jgi:hypothetical protein
MNNNDWQTNKSGGRAVILALLLVAGLIWRWVRARASQEQEPAPDAAPVARALHIHHWGDVSVQLPDEGAGPLYHRRYTADIARPRLSAEALVARIVRDLPNFSPRALAEFRKIKGRRGSMAVGDEYHIKILGPWNGSVRVSEVTRDSFTFVTLEGHPEAGQIRFQARPHPEQRNVLRFEIMSWARSRDLLVSAAYEVGQIGKVVQKNVWVEFCTRAAQTSGGQLLGEVVVYDEERSYAEVAAAAEGAGHG